MEHKRTILSYKKYIVSLLLFINCANVLFANSKALKPKDKREFDIQKIEEARQSDEYAYILEEEKPVTFGEWIEAMFIKFLDWLSGSEIDQKKAVNIWDWVLFAIKWLVIVIVIVLIISTLLGVDIHMLFRKNYEIKQDFNAHKFDENIDEIDFEKMIEQYLAKGDFQYAIRLLYLKNLKTLSDAKLIKWRQDKTNLDYLNELSDKEIKFNFRKVTQLFNYIWYGKFEIDATAFATYKNDFEEFENKITVNA